MSNEDARRVLVVDDDSDHGSFLVEILADHGYLATSVCSGAAALETFSKDPTEAVVTDVHMTGIDGVAVIARLAGHAAQPALIAITAFGSLDTAVRALRAGAVDYLSKPFATADLVEAIGRALDRRARALERAHMQEEVDDLLRRRRP